MIGNIILSHYCNSCIRLESVINILERRFKLKLDRRMQHGHPPMDDGSGIRINCDHASKDNKFTE